MNATHSSTLADLLLKRATIDGDKELLVYQHGDGTRDSVTGAELLERAQQAAATLRNNGVVRGDHVLLMLTAQSDFIDTFLGAIWADAVPVPLFPPMFSTRPQDFIANFSAIAATSGARVLIASEEIASKMEGFAKHLGSDFRVLPHRRSSSNSERLRTPPTRLTADLVFLQFTSGSTGTPKGVALSHANVIANLQAIGRAAALDQDDKLVTWLPLYHDMGLISVLAALHCGGRIVMLSPLDFTKDPAIWLRTISEHEGTVSPAPNFAFRRCLGLADDDIAGLDLSSWRVAFNGAEPIDPDTVEQFTRRFEPYGFRSSTLYPVYGLAEHTLAVSFPPLGQGPYIDTVDRNQLAKSGIAKTVRAGNPDSVSFVSVGTPLEGVSVEIHDEQGSSLCEGQVGEVIVKSASVMTGYFNNDAATAEAIADGWLKTGDLGYLKDDMLYITGRIKDLIIRAGRNYYPTDIESAATSVKGIRAGRAAAFSVSARPGEENVVLLAESSVSGKQQRSRLIREIVTAVTARVGFRPERVELYARGTLPITSSGKVRRRVARARFINGEFDLPSATALAH
jgi:acyl-CoA synthetase (AMP-forming)/AMP-acid ligase II